MVGGGVTASQNDPLTTVILDDNHLSQSEKKKKEDKKEPGRVSKFPPIPLKKGEERKKIIKQIKKCISKMTQQVQELHHGIKTTVIL